jgi:hypothetical protein
MKTSLAVCAELGPEHIRAYQLHLLQACRASISYYNRTRCALRIFYWVTLGRDDVAASIVTTDFVTWAANRFKSMIVRYRKTADGHRKDLRKCLDPVLDPFLAAVISFTEQERAANAARHALRSASQ